MEGKELTCIVCPIGCRLHVTLNGDTIDRISGNRCKRGTAYAREECTAPKRVLTTTVPVVGGVCPLVSVKTERAVPKQLIRQCMEELHTVRATAPVRIGDILRKNICGTGVDIIATQMVPPL